MINDGKNEERFSEVAILQSLRNEGNASPFVLKSLYRGHFEEIKFWVLKHDGNEDDAHDLFQDAVIALYESVKAGTYQHKKPIAAFLFTVCRNRWYSLQRKKGYFRSYQEEVLNTNSPDLPIQYLEGERAFWLAKLFDTLQEDCRTLLNAAYYQEASMQEIAQLMNFKNEQVARNKKHKCLGALKKLIRKSPFWVGVLDEIR